MMEGIDVSNGREARWGKLMYQLEEKREGMEGHQQTKGNTSPMGKG
jgi:hypothetical protein